MPTRTFLKRIGRAEEALKAHSIFSIDCICFPKKEQPFFGFPIERDMAGAVKCPLHGSAVRSSNPYLRCQMVARETLGASVDIPQ